MTNDDTSKELFYVAGDAPDPTGGRARGVEVGHDLTKSALGHPFLHYRMGSTEIFLEPDVFAPAGQPPYILIKCPWCTARGKSDKLGLTIRWSAKRFDYDPEGVAPFFPGWSAKQMKETLNPSGNSFAADTGGVLTIYDSIGCTWEEDPELARAGDGVAGFSKCGWKVRIIDNVVSDVR